MKNHIREDGQKTIKIDGYSKERTYKITKETHNGYLEYKYYLTYKPDIVDRIINTRDSLRKQFIEAKKQESKARKEEKAQASTPSKKNK